MRVRRKIALGLAGVLALGLAPAWAQEPEPASSSQPEIADCAERVARAVQGRYEGIRDLSARFEQTTRSASLGVSAPASQSVSRGEVTLAKPGRMRWSYSEPEESLVVSDGSVLWIYDPAAKEAQRLPAPKQYLSGAALQFLLGEGDLLSQFEITATDCEAARVQLELVPREEATYERIGLAADPESGDVRATTVTDLLGNVTEVAFREVSVNTDPPPETFRFRPPPGVEVIELEPGK